MFLVFLSATGPGMPHYSGMHGAPVSTMSMHPASAPHPSSGMLPPAPPHHGQFTSGHPSMMPPNNSIYSSQGHGLYSPMSASLGQDMPGPPSGVFICYASATSSCNIFYYRIENLY